LLSDFRRDVGRFLKGERDRYPAMPQHYFDAATEAALAAFRQRAEQERSEDLLAAFPVPPNPALVAGWQPFAVTIYRNWLSALSAQKQRLLRPAQYMAALRLDQAPAPAV
jgi:homoserine O-succinyltransferase